MIPAASTTVALLTDPFCAEHPLVRVQLESGLRSAEILDRIRRFELDAGLVHPDGEDTAGLLVTPLYEELHVLVAGSELPTGRSGTIGWQDALELPMCLLNTGMRGRQLIDDALATRGLAASPQLETDSAVTLLAHIGTGRWASIIPQAWLRSLVPPAGARVLALDGPAIRARVALVTDAAEPGSVLTRALIRTAQAVDVDASLRVPPGPATD
ncbi:LysR substrate binding domain-containing protein [Rhodococcus maanshanensis]|uniref:LysR substrate binding domain-containing protein n=1 Tax=Rhodococcus maanshanensis TaxID=183556 RepID=A0A1H7RTR5_9NOCA|nr:LysR substrate binding domain-containing protein [Rhodococcus maanshanensis]